MLPAAATCPQISEKVKGSWWESCRSKAQSKDQESGQPENGSSEVSGIVCTRGVILFIST